MNLKKYKKLLMNSEIKDFKNNVHITGIGQYLPKKRLTNKNLSILIQKTPEWIKIRTGIEERRIADNNQNTSDLAFKASKSAISSANINENEIDLIILATSTPDSLIPSTASIIAAKLKTKNIPAFDIHASCSGFLFAISIGKAFIESNQAKNVLIVGSEIRSRFIDLKDCSTAVLYGDGAGAVILSKCNNPKKGIIDIIIGGDGKGKDALTLPLSNSMNKDTSQTIRINQKALLTKAAIKGIINLILTCLTKNKISLSEIKLIIPHQMNKRIIESIIKKLKISENKFYINIEKYGNTSAASIPIALNEALINGKIKSDDLIMLVSFGAGFTYGVTLIKW